MSDLNKNPESFNTKNHIKESFGGMKYVKGTANIS